MLCWSHIPYCWKSHVVAQMYFNFKQYSEKVKCNFTPNSVAGGTQSILVQPFQGMEIKKEKKDQTGTNASVIRTFSGKHNL